MKGDHATGSPKGGRCFTKFWYGATLRRCWVIRFSSSSFFSLRSGEKHESKATSSRFSVPCSIGEATIVRRNISASNLQILVLECWASEDNFSRARAWHIQDGRWLCGELHGRWPDIITNLNSKFLRFPLPVNRQKPPQAP